MHKGLSIAQHSRLIRNEGNFLGPLVFKENEAPYYTTGWITTVATSAGAVVLAISYREALDLCHPDVR